MQLTDEEYRENRERIFRSFPDYDHAVELYNSSEFFRMIIENLSRGVTAEVMLMHCANCYEQVIELYRKAVLLMPPPSIVIEKPEA